jgi:hypothetical protein
MKAVWRNGQWLDKETGQPLPDVSNGLQSLQIQSDIPAYYSMASFKWVDGRRARRDDLARTGCREVDPSEGPKYCTSKKWAKRLGMEWNPEPGAGQPAHRKGLPTKRETVVSS